MALSLKISRWHQKVVTYDVPSVAALGPKVVIHLKMSYFVTCPIVLNQLFSSEKLEQSRYLFEVTENLTNVTFVHQKPLLHYWVNIALDFYKNVKLLLGVVLLNSTLKRTKEDYIYYFFSYIILSKILYIEI